MYLIKSCRRQLLFLSYFLAFSPANAQEKSNAVFQSDNEIIYIRFIDNVDKKISKNGLISFELKLNNEYFHFVQSDVKENYKKKLVSEKFLPRKEIYNQLIQDNSHKKLTFVLVKKKWGVSLLLYRPSIS